MKAMMSDADSTDRELQALRQELVLGAPALAGQRVLSRLERSIPELAAAAAPPAGYTVAKAPLPGSGFTGAAKLWLLGAFALGGAVGATAVAKLERAPETRVVYVDRPAHAAAPVEAPARDARGTGPSLASNPSPSIETPAAKKSAVTRPAPQAPPTPTSAVVAATPAELAGAADLGEQQALLDQARASLGRGDGPGALESLKAHSSRFPESVLTEEREALTIKSLVKAGRAADARARFLAFEARFPRSPLLPSLRATTANVVTETKP
jgi:hypothetical protein